MGKCPISNNAIRAHNLKLPMPSANEMAQRPERGTWAERRALKLIASYKYGMLGGHWVTKKDVIELAQCLPPEILKDILKGD